MPASTIDQVVVRMDGFPGAPGFMTFYGDDAVSMHPAIVTFLNAVRTAFPADVTFSVPGEGSILMDDTGTLTGTWSGLTPTTVAGTGSGGYSAASGACITWATAAIVNGRRLRGRTFLVPLTGLAYESDGSILGPTLSQLRTAASGLWVAAALRVWHRPTAPGASDGSSSPVTGSTVADRAAVLRSRRA